MVETLFLFMDKTLLLLRIVKHSLLFFTVPRGAWKVDGHTLCGTGPQRLGKAAQYPKSLGVLESTPWASFNLTMVKLSLKGFEAVNTARLPSSSTKKPAN